MVRLSRRSGLSILTLATRTSCQGIQIKAIRNNIKEEMEENYLFYKIVSLLILS